MLIAELDTDIRLIDLAVDAHADQHDEEEEGKELGCWHAHS